MPTYLVLVERRPFTASAFFNFAKNEPPLPPHPWAPVSSNARVVVAANDAASSYGEHASMGKGIFMYEGLKNPQIYLKNFGEKLKNIFFDSADPRVPKFFCYSFNFQRIFLTKNVPK